MGLTSLHSLAASETARLEAEAQPRRGPRGHLLLPGGIGRTSLSVGEEPTPLVVRGEGYRLWDHRGRELIDANNNFTVSVHGHAHPEIVEAAESALRDGASFGLPNLYEWKHAEVLLERLPALDQVRYTNSGTEAVMTALRVARASTGRDACLVVRDGYHGTSDVALCAGGDRYARGVPQGVIDGVTVIPLNDTARLRDAIEGDPGRYAALLIDLLPNRAGLMALSSEFVELARTLTAQHGILLIVDEVISLRLGPHGLSGEYGVTPDLMTVGKIIGGGFPVGAVVGREEVMRELAVTSQNFLEHGGTFTGNPVSMAAGAVSLRLLTAGAIARLNDLGDDARRAVEARVSDAGWEVRGRGSLLRPFPRDAARVDAKLQRRLWWAAYDRGLLLTQANCAALSTPMTDAVVADVADRLADAVLAVADTLDA
jgi:glutamate-1-semialdehyde 2,1-aminomutase